MTTNTTLIFTWTGIIVTGIVLTTAIIIAIVWLYHFCVELKWDVQKRYQRSLLHKKFINRAGFDCANWLIHYNRTHGRNRSKFTAYEWEKFFAEQCKREVEQKGE